LSAKRAGGHKGLGGPLAGEARRLGGRREACCFVDRRDDVEGLFEFGKC
jgi:hypothetical protein